MTDYAELALLPEGLHDDLPPFAGHEGRSIERLVTQFEGHGYERVKPPLIESSAAPNAPPSTNP